MSIEASNESILVHQALHGYSDGHRLLASSKNLSKKSMRMMLVLSDMSGPNMIPGFRSYLTGYPIEDEDLYGFSKTWYASEMERSGCVWTHTLLIAKSAFDLIRDISVIKMLFKRPAIPIPAEHYEKPIEIHGIDFFEKSNGVLESSTPNLNFQSIAERVLISLYGGEDYPPIVIEAGDSETYEELVLNIWSQQWPSLRSEFRFCTGSISNRLVNGENFHLQIIPERNTKIFLRDMPHSMLIDSEQGNYSKEAEGWIAILLQDLFQNDEELRMFLWESGGLVAANRSECARLMRLYKCIRTINSGNASLDTLIEELATQYPNAKEGTALKRRILGPCDEQQVSFFKGVSERDILSSIAFTENYSMLSDSTLEIRDRARRLWTSETQESQELLLEMVQSDVNPFGEQFLLGVSDVIEFNEILGLTANSPRLLFIFVERRPELACHEEFWSGGLDYRLELLDHMTKKAPLERELTISLTNCMLEAGAVGMAEHAYKHLGSAAIHGMLEWFDRHALDESINLPSDWLLVLRVAPEDSLGWLSSIQNPSLVTVALIASELNPSSRTVLEFGTGVWLDVTNRLTNSPNMKMQRILAEFLLPFGLNNPGPDSDRLVAFSFEVIHEALARDEMRYQSWKRLEKILPALNWWRSWDKCERLRRGLILAFVRYNWSTVQFIYCASQIHTLRQLMKTARDVKGGYRFIRKVARDAFEGELAVGEEQLELLERYRF